jgi:hypothetical protein
MQNVLENGLKDFHDNNRAPKQNGQNNLLGKKQQRNIARIYKEVLTF